MNPTRLSCAVAGSFVVLSSLPAQADDKAECLAAYDRAQDLRQQAKLVGARQQLLVCVRDVCPAAISRDCGQWLKEVETALPTATVSAKDASGNDLISVRVTLDGTVWLPTLDGKAHPVDPGPHTLSFETSNLPVVTEEVLIREGEKDRAITVTMGTEKAAPPQTPPPTQVVPTAPPPAVKPPPAGGGWMKPAGAVIASVGVATIATGAVLGVVASLEWNDAKNKCGTSCPPGSAGFQPATDAKNGASTSADWSTALFVAGGVATLTGAILFLAAPSSRGESIRVGLAPYTTGMGVSLSGRF